MLFAATSINYMDRQVLAILKPTLQHSIGMTEVDYGYIVLPSSWRTQWACWRRDGLIDKLGTRVGYCVFMAVWSLSAMGHALANYRAGVRHCAFLSGAGRVGQLSGGDQDSGRVVSAEGAVAGDGHL